MNVLPAREKSRLILFKITEREFTLVRKRANKYAKGNVSAWLRWAGVNCNPGKKK